MENQIFRQLGFLDAEVEVYKTLLIIGPSVVSKINQKTGLHRTHIYDLLEKLREKGLVSTFTVSGKKNFKAAPPSNILSYVEEKSAAVKELLPSFEKLISSPKENTQVELFKGKNGLKSALQDVLNCGKDYCVMGSVKRFEEIIEFAFPHFLDRVEKAKIKERIICDVREKVIRIKTGKYRYLDGGYLIPSSFWVYGDKVILFVWNEPYHAIVIENKDIARSYQSYFDFFWKLSKS